MMEPIALVRIEKPPEGPCLATLHAVHGLVAQGRTITETLEIARTVARRLLAAQAEGMPPPHRRSRPTHSTPARHQRLMGAKTMRHGADLANSINLPEVRELHD